MADTVASTPEGDAPPELTFSDLGVADDFCRALRERGILEPFKIQRLAIADAIAGRDVCGKAKTGSGKTLAFGLPVLQRLGKATGKDPRALILVPTRELANQVADEIAPLGAVRELRTEAVYGGTDLEKQAKHLGSGCDVVVATPGRLIDLIGRDAVDLTSVEIVVVDEADRMADMGFLPQVEWLLRHTGGTHQTLLFSATLDGAVETLVTRYQSDPVRHEVASPTVTVDSMVHHFLLVHHMDKEKVAAAAARAVGRTIMFVRTKRAADKLLRELLASGVKAGAIHGDLRQKERERSLAKFTDGSYRVLVATDVAARGIHVDDIDMVIHYDPAEDHKSYLHRSGRTARAGEDGIVVTLTLWDQELEVRRLMRRLGLDLPIVQIFSNDERLTHLQDRDLEG